MSTPFVKINIPLPSFYVGIPSPQFEIELHQNGAYLKWVGDYQKLEELNVLYKKMYSGKIVYEEAPFSMPIFIKHNHGYSSLTDALQAVISFVSATTYRD